jgi:hypothetical protein
MGELLLAGVARGNWPRSGGLWLGGTRDLVHYIGMVGVGAVGLTARPLGHAARGELATDGHGWGQVEGTG